MQAVIRYQVPVCLAFALVIAATLQAKPAIAQTVGEQGYTLPQDDGSVVIALPEGRFTLNLGYGCDGLNVPENVSVIAGSGGVATLTPVGTDMLCDVFIGQAISDVPCVADANGICDIVYETPD